MSPLRSIACSAGAAARRSTTLTRRYNAPRASASASIHTTIVRWAAKESAQGNEERAKEIETHKEDLLKKQKEGRGHWKDELASDSESIVKADRGEIDASPDKIEQLQKETEKLAQKKR